MGDNCVEIHGNCERVTHWKPFITIAVPGSLSLDKAIENLLSSNARFLEIMAGVPNTFFKFFDTV